MDLDFTLGRLETCSCEKWQSPQAPGQPALPTHPYAASVRGGFDARLKRVASACRFVSSAAPRPSPAGLDVVSNSLACLARAYSSERSSPSSFQPKHDPGVKWVCSGEEKHGVSKVWNILRSIPVDLAESFQNRSSQGRCAMCKGSVSSASTNRR